MLTNDLNTGLIEAVKEKIPAGGSIANILMDILHLGKEAMYRRLRGEVPFTLTEAAIISKELGISLDNTVGASFVNNAVFDLNIVQYTDPIETYNAIIGKHTSIFRAVKDDPCSEMAISSNIIPQTFYFKYDMLSKFRLFKWMYQSENVKCNSFDKLVLPPKLLDSLKEFVEVSQQISSTTYIWDNMVFLHLVNDIQYFASIQLITDADKAILKAELHEMLNELEAIALKGKFASGNKVKIYLSNINFEATYSYVCSTNSQLCLMRIYSINSITTQDAAVFTSVKEWIQSLKKFSTLISSSGEMHRIEFFTKQHEIVNRL